MTKNSKIRLQADQDWYILRAAIELEPQGDNQTPKMRYYLLHHCFDQSQALEKQDSIHCTILLDQMLGCWYQFESVHVRVQNELVVEYYKIYVKNYQLLQPNRPKDFNKMYVCVQNSASLVHTILYSLFFFLTFS